MPPARNPFQYGSPVSGDHFTGREAELEALVTRMVGHISVVVSAPRRYGKSSLIREATAVLEGRRPAPAVLSTNLLGAADLATVASQLLTQLYAAPGGTWSGARQGLRTFLGRLRVRPSVEVGTDGSTRFVLAPSLSSTDGISLIGEIIEALDGIGARRPAVVVLDEFQVVADIDPGLPGALKAAMDSHPRVSVVLAGSRAHLMDALTRSSAAPLYGMCQPIQLGAIPDADWVPHLKERASSAGRPFDGIDSVHHLLDLARPIPYDIQQLAFSSWEAATRHIDRSSIETGLEQIFVMEASGYAERIETLSRAQRRVLSFLARAGADSPPAGSQAFANQVGLANPTSVRKAISVLVERELVIGAHGGWQIDDPFLAEWLRRAAAGGS